MKKLIVAMAALLGLSIGGIANAATIGLYDWAYNQDGTTTSGALFSGLGTKSFTVSGAGAHNFIVFFDHEIDESINTFFNEYGVVHGAAAAGQSWEIDEPGFVFGDIYANLTAGALDNTNAIIAAAPDDVSMAMGWNFNLLAGETATLSFILSDLTQPGGFFLEQFDPDSQASIFFSSTLEIGDGTPAVPEPSTMLLLGAGLAGLGFYSRRRRDKL